MERSLGPKSSGRRQFLTTTGLVAAAAALPNAASALAGSPSADPQTREPLSKDKMRKIPIGVFDPAFPDLSLDQLLDKYSSLGVEAAEIGTGGYPGNKHCPVDELLSDPAKAKAYKKKFEDKNILLATLSCHGNPVHPDPKIAARDAETIGRAHV